MDWKKAVFLALGLAVVFSFFSFIGISEIMSVIWGANLLYLFIAFLFEILILLFTAIKLDSVIRNQGKLSLTKGRWTAGKYVSVKFAQVFRASVLGLVVSFMTPISRIGGEPVKIYLLRKNGIGVAVSTAIVAVDTFTESFSYYVIVLFSMLFVLFTGKMPYSAIYPYISILLISSALLIIFLLMCFSYPILCKVVNFVKWATSKFSYSLSGKMKESRKDYAWMFYDIFRLVMTNKRVMANIFALSFVVKFLEFMRMYFIFLAFGFEISVSTIMIAWSIMLLAGLIPLLPGGLGLVEASGTYAYMLFDIPKSVAGASMVIDRLFSYWFVIFLGMIIMSYDGIRERFIEIQSHSERLFLIFARRLKHRIRRKYKIPK